MPSSFKPNNTVRINYVPPMLLNPWGNGRINQNLFFQQRMEQAEQLARTVRQAWDEEHRRARESRLFALAEQIQLQIDLPIVNNSPLVNNVSSPPSRN